MINEIQKNIQLAQQLETLSIEVLKLQSSMLQADFRELAYIQHMISDKLGEIDGITQQMRQLSNNIEIKSRRLVG